MIEIQSGLAIPEHEIWFEYATSPGPGGQHVNRSLTRATLCFSVEGSGTLGDSQKRRVQSRLGNRIGKDGVLRISSHDSRSQVSNRRAATERFAELLREALKPRKVRRKTRPSRASNQRRLDAKQRRSDIKKGRRRPREW